MIADISQYFTSSKDFLITVGEIVGAVGIGVGIGVIGAIKKRNISLKWCSKKNKMFVDKHSHIHEMLTELRLVLRASRCLIFQFHNGGVFSDGSSIKRFSVTHESCGNGVSSMILDSQDVLITRYVDLIQNMDHSSDKILSVTNLQPSSFRSGLEINNVCCYSISPLRSVDGVMPIGFVCCHWCSLEQLDEIYAEGVSEESLKELIKNSANNINSLLLMASSK